MKKARQFDACDGSVVTSARSFGKAAVAIGLAAAQTAQDDCVLPFKRDLSPPFFAERAVVPSSSRTPPPAVRELERYQSSVMHIGDNVKVFLLRYPRTLFCRITCIEVLVRTGRSIIQRTFDANDNGWSTKRFAGPDEVRRFVRDVLAESESLIAS